MPMLPLHVGWCLPLSTPSNKIVLPTPKLTSYCTLKHTTHTLPYPKTHPKTHNSQWFGWRWHKEVVSAQGAAVGSTVRIGGSFCGSSASAPQKHKNNGGRRNTTQQNIYFCKSFWRCQLTRLHSTVIVENLEFGSCWLLLSTVKDGA